MLSYSLFPFCFVYQLIDLLDYHLSCRVNEGLHVKLTDCALARDLYPGDYHCLGDNENRPIKWLALESLTHKVFTPASDVVSYIEKILGNIVINVTSVPSKWKEKVGKLIDCLSG